MVVRALIVVVALLVAHGPGAAQQATRGAPQSDYKRSRTATTGPDNRPTVFDGACKTVSEFVDAACYLTVPYQPSAVVSGNGPLPSCASTKLTDTQKAALTAAFTRAPDYAQSRLCRLTRFFIVPPSLGMPWDSWGLWVRKPKANPTTKAVYIAISEDRIPREGAPAVTTAADAENAVLVGILPAIAQWQLAWTSGSAFPPPPKYTSSGGTEMGLLSAIAHELGHVSFADANADQQTNRPTQAKDCFKTNFIDASWLSYSKRRWVPFAASSGARHKNTSIPEPSGISSKLNPNGYGDASKLLSQVSGTEFVNLFAAVSPEEDFIEAYKYRVYADAQLQDLTLSFPGKTGDPPVADPQNALAPLSAGGPSLIRAKLDCMTDLGVFTAIQ